MCVKDEHESVGVERFHRLDRWARPERRLRGASGGAIFFGAWRHHRWPWHLWRQAEPALFFFYIHRQTDTHTVENKRPPPERDERNETAEWQLAVAGRKREAVSATFFLSAHREAGARQCIVVDGHEDPHGAPAARRPAARAGVVVFADAGAGPATVAAASAAAAAAAGARRRNGPVT